jgi:hypothetical protein
MRITLITVKMSRAIQMGSGMLADQELIHVRRIARVPFQWKYCGWVG